MSTEPVAANAPGYTVWINGVQYDDRNTDPWDVPSLRRLGGIPDDHDLFVESAAWERWRDENGRHKRLVHVEAGQDVKLAIDDPPVDLAVHRRFYSTPRYINAS